MYEVGSGMTDENIEAMKAYDFTKVIVITKDHERTLARLKGQLAVLDGFDDLDAGGDWVLSCHDRDQNPYVVINLQSVEVFERVAKTLKTVAMIDRENPTLRIGP